MLKKKKRKETSKQLHKKSKYEFTMKPIPSLLGIK